jgi:hypothetical protein
VDQPLAMYFQQEDIMASALLHCASVVHISNISNT